MNKWTLYIVCILILGPMAGKSQCLVNSLVINTGYNPLTNTAIPPGANGATPVIDPKWKLTAVSSGVAIGISSTPIPGLIGVVPGGNADVVASFWMWASNPWTNPGGWISCLNSNTYNTDGTGPSGTQYNMTLSRSFKMCSEDNITLAFNIANDNYIISTDIDGTPLSFSQPVDTTPANYEMFTYFTQTVYLGSGMHTVNVKTANYDVVYPSPNPTGLDIYGTISSATGTNSLVSESNPACSSYECAIALPACDSVLLPDTLRACAGTTITLPGAVSGTDSIINIAWNPAAGLSNPAILTPSLTVTSSSWYALTVISSLSDNLIVNGDFNAGNTGFSSGYTFNPTPPPPGTASVPGQYEVGTNPYIYNTAWPGMGDHTTGTGNMLFMDASTTAGVSFWCETLTVTPYQNYAFSVWSALLHAPTPNIMVTINGISVDSFTTSTLLASWTQNQFTWNSGPSTSATICMTDANTTFLGNDFAIDDISFKPSCNAKDSVYVAVTDSGTSTHTSNTSFCSDNGSIPLSAPAGYSSYTWSTGATTAAISVGSGIYWVDASISCASVTDTFHVTSIPSPVVNLGNDTVICAGASVVLSSPQPAGAAYLWSTGSTDSTFIIQSGGSFTLTVTRSGCTGSSTIKVAELTKPGPVFLGADTILCAGNELQLNITTGANSVMWSTGSTQQNIVVTESGAYWVSTSNACGKTSDTIQVGFEPCNIWFPSAFTPNGDGLNDIIKVAGNLSRFTNFSLAIYNRWGQRVFYTEDIYSGWDGKLNGVAEDLGTYFYMIQYKLDGKKHMMKGDFQLIR